MEEKKAITQSFKNIIESLWHIQENEKNLTKKLKKIFQIIWAATTRFQDEGDLLRAGAIAFQIVISAIPLLVLGLFVVDTVSDLQTYEALAKEFTRKHDIPLDISIYFQLFYSLLENKGALTGVGVLIVLFSATSILNKLEEAMNRIWGVKKPRPILIRIAFFVMIIVLGPFLITVGIGIGKNLVAHFASPNLKSIKNLNGIWTIVGDKHVYIQNKNNKWEYVNILDKIDFEGQRSVVVLDGNKNKRLLGDELLPYRDRIRKANYSTTSKASFMDIACLGEKIWIVTNNGSIISSIDNGETWKIRNYQLVEDNVLIPARFQKIKIWNDLHGTIIGDRGLILSTFNGGENWEPTMIPNFRNDLYDLEFIENGKLFAVGQNFSFLISENFGKDWKTFSPIQNLNEYNLNYNLNGITKKGNSIYIIGDSGTILYSKDFGKTWNKKDIGMKNFDFHDLYFINENFGIIVGDDGVIRLTQDGGYNWIRSNSHTKENLNGIGHNKESDLIYIVGSNYKLLEGKIQPNNTIEFKVIKSSPFWRITVSFVGNFLIPFILIWMVFFILYKGLPNTNVEFKSAAIGATVTAVLWVIFLIGFQYYATYFLNKKFALYGTLAAIPLLLILINLSVMIVLYGSEISYLIQNPAMTEITYKSRSQSYITKFSLHKGFHILKVLYENYEKGKPGTPEKDLLKICQQNELEFNRLTNIMQSKGWIAKIENRNWTPIVDSSQISIIDFIHSISTDSFEMEDFNDKDPFKKKLKNLFNQIESTQNEKLKEMSFKSLLS